MAQEDIVTVYARSLIYQRAEIQQQLVDQLDAIETAAAARSSLRSGSTMKKIAGASREMFKKAVGQFLADEGAAIDQPMVDEEAIEQHTEDALEILLAGIEAESERRLEKIAGARDSAFRAAKQLMPLAEDMKHFLSRHRSGLGGAGRQAGRSAPATSVSYNVSVANATNSIFQTGTNSSNASQEFGANIEQVLALVEKLERQLEELDSKSIEIAEIKSDVQSMKLQLV